MHGVENDRDGLGSHGNGLDARGADDPGLRAVPPHVRGDRQPGAKAAVAGDGGGRAQDWDSLLQGVNARVDWPSGTYWRELIEVYRQATVVLTRRSPESWRDSLSNTIMKSIATNDDPASVSRVLIAGQVFGGRMAEHEHARALYRANVEAIPTEVPPERLLGDGWATLCAHLNVPIPDVPHPHGNTVEAFHTKVATQGRS